MQAKSIKGNSTDEISSALAASMADGYNPTLAVIFISVKQDWRGVRKLFDEKGIDVLGANSCGEFTDGYQDDGTAVILLLDIKKEHYSIFFETVSDRDLVIVAAAIAKAALSKFKKPAIILCSTGVSTKGEMFPGHVLAGSIETTAGSDVKFYGGMAGDDGTFTGSYVFTNDQETDIGVAALVLDEDKISIHGMSVSGWQPIGTSRIVTRSEGDLVYEIDGQPALELYLRYLGQGEATIGQEYNILEDVGVFYPFQVEETSDPIMRTPIAVDKEKNALRFDFEIPEGTRFKFSVPPDFDIVENVLEKATALRDTVGAAADALLIFSCVGRLNALGPMAKMENDGLSEIWKAPMAGFFTYGEYGMTSDGRQEFCSTTNSWVALKEK